MDLTGLVLYLSGKFGAVSAGGVWPDASDAGNDAQLGANILVTESDGGVFDGTGGASPGVNVSAGNDITITVWCRSGASTQNIYDNTPGSAGWRLRPLTNDMQAIRFYTGATRTASGATSYTGWQFFAATFSRTAVTIRRNDGAPVQTTFADSAPVASAQAGQIGQTVEIDGRWNGNIDDLTMWTRVLSDLEIETIRQAQLARHVNT